MNDEAQRKRWNDWLRAHGRYEVDARGMAPQAFTQSNMPDESTMNAVRQYEAKCIVSVLLHRISKATRTA